VLKHLARQNAAAVTRTEASQYFDQRIRRGVDSLADSGGSCEPVSIFKLN
jgi:hypothetical protein